MILNGGVKFKELIDTIRQDDNNSNEIMHLACALGSYDICQYIISSGDIDINATDQHGRTALHYAAKFGHYNIC